MHLFRGGSLTPKDLPMLKNKYGVNKIVSLDADVAKKIDRSAKLLGIEHVDVSIDIARKSSLLNFLEHDIRDLLGGKGEIVYVGCRRGMDRTGLAIALYRCIHDHWSPKKAWKEAVKYGLGINLDPSIINLYHKIINKAGIKEDSNSAYDIVENVREIGHDPYTLGENAQQSWSPYADSAVRTFPYATTYKDFEEQYQTRQDYGLDDSDINKFEPEQSVPMSGQYDSVSGISGAGPFLGGSGYIYASPYMRQHKVYAINLSYEVPSEDKDRANKAILYFDHLLKLLKSSNEHLNLIYTPFKDNGSIAPEQAYQARAGLRRYRDKVAENFNQFKRIAFKCFLLLQPFSSDTQIIKLNKSFVMSIGDIEKQVNRFIDLFANINSKDFIQGIIKAVENIKKEISQIEQIIEDRIKSHIYNNILARNWVDTVSDELQEKVEQKVPLSIQLVEKRNEEIKDEEDDNVHKNR